MRGLSKRPLHRNPWVGGFLTVGGIACLIGGFFTAREARAFLDSTDRAPGTVIELKRERGVKGLREDYPMVQFSHPVSDTALTFKSKVGLWPSPFDVGDEVLVAFDPLDPEKAEIVSFWTIWLPRVALFVFGSLCLGAGLLTLRWIRS
jgi:hypothetical protein